MALEAMRGYAVVLHDVSCREYVLTYTHCDNPVIKTHQLGVVRSATVKRNGGCGRSDEQHVTQLEQQIANTAPPPVPAPVETPPAPQDPKAVEALNAVMELARALKLLDAA
jgi:hypothetical protein